MHSSVSSLSPGKNPLIFSFMAGGEKGRARSPCGRRECFSRYSFAFERGFQACDTQILTGQLFFPDISSVLLMVTIKYAGFITY